MHKRKHGPRLFELLGEDQNEATAALEVPRWWSRSRRPGQAVTPGEAQSGTGEEGGDVAPAPARIAPEPASFFKLDGERIRLSFTSTKAAAVVFVAAVVLLASFEMGSRMGRRKGLKAGYDAGRASYAADAANEIEVARAQPPATHVVSSLLEEPPAAEPREATSAEEDTWVAKTPGWIRDYTYIMAQEFGAERLEDARRAQTYLADHGIPVELVRLPGNAAIQLITEQGYNHGDAAQRRIADDLLQRVHAVGAKYYAEGGGYKLEGYYKTLKSDSW